MIAKRKRQRRRAVAVRYLSIITVLLLVVIVVGWVMGFLRKPAGTPSASADGSAPTSGGGVAATVNPLPMDPVAPSRRVEPATWVSIDRGPQYDGQDMDAIRLENQAFVSRGPQYVLFSARVICSTFDIIEEATLQLELVDRDGRAYSQTAPRSRRWACRSRGRRMTGWTAWVGRCRSCAS